MARGCPIAGDEQPSLGETPWRFVRLTSLTQDFCTYLFAKLGLEPRPVG
jgi:hypothetical protein